MKLRPKDIIHPYGGINLKPKRKTNRARLGAGLVGLGLTMLALLLRR